MHKEIERSAQSKGDFIKIRADLESFLLKYKHFVSTINAKYGSGMKSYKHLYRLYSLVIDQLKNESEIEGVVQSVLKSFDYLKETDEDKPSALHFTEGGPWIVDSEYKDLWLKYKKQMENDK